MRRIGSMCRRLASSQHRAAKRLNCCTLLWWTWKFSSVSQTGLWYTKQQWQRNADYASPLPGKAGRQTAYQVRAGSLVGEWHGMLALSSPRLPSPLHCSCPEWFYKHFASGSIPVLINHCGSDPSKTQSSLELRDGRSERERLQRGWRKRESLQPQWKGEEVQGKRSESKREADAELKAGGEAGFGQRCQATGIGENGNCFLIKGGGVRATNDYCFKYAGKWLMEK